MLSLIASIGAFIPGLFGKQISFKAAKIAGIGLLLVAAVAIFSLAKWSYDRSVINQYSAEAEATALGKELDAQRKADEEAAAQATELAQTHEALDRAGIEAARQNPSQAAQPVGPVSKSYYDTLRHKETRP